MRLWHTKTVWEKLAQRDPYWAVLTDPEKKNQRWEVTEFFATGRQTIKADLKLITAAVPALSRERALDFGCGVGRLTQGLAEHFGHVDGVDVARTMIERALRHNQHPGRVNYYLNTSTHLGLFPDGQFDLVYSVISLQHIPSVLIAGYLKEFCRITRPGGVIFFQLPANSPSYQFKFSWYPPTLWKRLKRMFLIKTAIQPEMTMNSLKKAQVLSIFTQNNANIVKVTPYDAADDLESYAYLFQKGSCR